MGNANQPDKGPHRLTMENRGRLSLTGVTEVDSFDDTAVILQTVQGTLVIRGQELQLKSLNLDGGQAAVDGVIDSLSYEQSSREGGWLRRLLG